MSARQKDWARRTRAQLITELGGQCALCGTSDNLEFDCITPLGDAHHKYDTSQRMSFYRQQHAANNLQLLCTDCNNDKSHTTDRAHWRYLWSIQRQLGFALMQTPSTEQPF